MAFVASQPPSLERRQGYQSQNISQGTVIDYWGFAVRVWPCTNDVGTCEYFEQIYGGHERGILYVGIMWSIVGALLLIWAVGRHFWSPHRVSEVLVKKPASDGGLRRLGNAIASTTRHYLLPDSVRLIFGRTSRLQVVVLGILFAYVCIFSFVGIGYKQWTTPASKAYLTDHPGLTQKRSWLGPWSDRIGTFAYALTPFSIMLASRESILSLLTGIPYQSFNFLHRWLGWIILIQGIAHTLGWTIIEAIFYQPQPQVAEKWIKQEYMIWGCVAILLICIMAILATPWVIRATGYEFFRKAHYVLAMLYIGACWGHWKPLKVFMVPGLCIWLVDRGARLIRSFLIHYSYLPDGSMGFQTSNAEMSLFRDEEHGDVVRLDYTHAHNPWKPGQHFYLCFTKASIWQSHPFTPLSLPVEKDGVVQHSYIFRAKKGETAKIAKMAAALAPEAGAPLTTPVVMQGPYGEDHTENLSPDVNVLCVAGGTGITYVLPTLLWLAGQPANPDRRIALVWSVRRRQDVEWVRKELDILTLAKKHKISITIHVTREIGSEPLSAIAAEKSVDVAASSAASSSSGMDSLMDVARREHPDLSAVVPAFVADNIRGRTVVFASGPGGMITDLRRFVSAANSGSKVWKGDESADVQLICDNRLEW